jgi:DNA-binding transcriptional MerR regulator
MAEPLWTLDELVGQVADVLADGYPGAPSARVRDLPDVRTVRWYVTRGLVDPPLAMRGRLALYGRRHLLQLVALKRRQAQGTPLASIQAELAGLPDAALAAIAGSASSGQTGPGQTGPGQTGPGQTGPETTDPGLPDPTATSTGAAAPPATPPAAPPAPGRVRFWTATPAGPVAGANELHDHHELHDHGRVGGAGAGIETVRRIQLAPGIVLLVDDAVAAHAYPLDAAALRAAAVPLLDVLQRPANGHDPTLDQRDSTDDEGTRR